MIQTQVQNKDLYLKSSNRIRILDTTLPAYAVERINNTDNILKALLYNTCREQLALRSASVMDSHATTWGSIPDGYAVLTELHVLRKGQ